MSKTKKEKIHITIPIFYPNSEPHIGSLSTAIIGNAIKNILKIDTDVYFTVGLDVHGTKIRQSALKEGKDIKIFLKEKELIYKDYYRIFNINYDRFINTEDEDHKIYVNNIWERLNEHIYIKEYTGYYSKSDEAFYKKEELIEEKAPTGSTVELINIDCYYLAISKVKEKLLELYSNKDFTIKNHNQQLINYVKDLKDICISREEPWGITIPNNKLPGQTIYVWFDALLNYDTTKYSFNILQNTNTIHLIGKDITIFHCVYLPAIYYLLNIEFNIKILINNWLVISNKKISKSLGNFKSIKDLIDTFCIYKNFLTNDIEFNEDEIKTIFNAQAVNKFSNMIYRLNCIGNDIDKDVYNEYKELVLKDIIHFKVNLNISEFLIKLLDYCDDINKDITEKEVWKHNKDFIIANSKAMVIREYMCILMDLIYHPGEMFFKKIN